MTIIQFPRNWEQEPLVEGLLNSEKWLQVLCLILTKEFSYFIGEIIKDNDLSTKEKLEQSKKEAEEILLDSKEFRSYLLKTAFEEAFKEVYERRLFFRELEEGLRNRLAALFEHIVNEIRGEDLRAQEC